MIPVPPDSELPLYRRRGSEFYWMEYLPKQKALFVKFNVVRDAEEESRLGAFSNEVIEFVEAKKVKKLTIDVRHNGAVTETSLDVLCEKFPRTNESTSAASCSSLRVGRLSRRR